jgi:osmotically-inducible protein OsmY
MRVREGKNRPLHRSTIFRSIFLASALVPALTGCVGLATGAGAMVGTMAMEERGLDGAISDTVIRGKITASYLEHDVNLNPLGIEVHEGAVMLTGTVPKTADRVEAVRYAWQVDGVKTVLNEIQVTDDSDVLDTARDTWVSAQLRLRITFDGRVQAINYAIDTVNGVVYLMGVAQSAAELSRVEDHARHLAYVRRIVSHVRIKQQSASR